MYRARLLLAMYMLIAIAGQRFAFAGQLEITRAADYLLSRQDPSGAFSKERGDLAVRDTAEVLQALGQLGFRADVRVQAAEAFLRAYPSYTTDLRSRALIGLRGLGPGPGGTSLDPQGALGLVSEQQRDGGFSFAPGYSESDPFDTALALLGVAPELEQAPTQLYSAIFYLSNRQYQDGGFGPTDNLPDIETTAAALSAFVRHQGSLIWLDVITSAQGFLLSHAAPNGAFGTLRQTIIASLALIESGMGQHPLVRNAIMLVEGSQAADGSFGGGDVEITALALRLIRYSLPNLQLVPQDVAFSTTSPASGDPVTVTVQVRNVGALPAAASMARLVRGDGNATVTAAEVMAPALPAGAATSVQLVWNTSGIEGVQTLRVSLDANNSVGESVEEDNTLAFAISVRPRVAPDLSLTTNDILFDPDRPTNGQPVTISALIHNSGDSAVGPFAVRFYDGDPLGGALLGEVALSGVASQGTATAALPPRGFSPPNHPITVVVDQAGAISETNESNNIAIRPLVIAQAVDFVVSNFDVSVTPSSPVLRNTAIQIGVRVANLGTETSPPSLVRVYRGTPTDGGVPLGDLAIGPIGAGQSAFQTLAANAGPALGTFAFYAVADPDRTLEEQSERNNSGSAIVEITAGANARFVSARMGAATTGFPIEGDPLDILFTVGNQGTQALSGLVVRFYDGNPLSGGKLVGERVLDLPAAPSVGFPVTTEISHVFPTLGLSTGTRDIYAWADPDNLIVEADETDNLFSFRTEIRPRPDCGIAAADLVIAPDPVEKSDRITVTATIRDFNAPDSSVLGNNATPRVQLYLGDPAADGHVLADQVVSFLFSTVAGVPGHVPVTVQAEVDAQALTGPQKIVCLVDAEAKVKDANRANNRAEHPFTIGDDTKADLAVARQDFLTTPSPVATESSATISVKVKNLRAVAAQGAHVIFYAGDPAQGAPVLDDKVVDVPGKGEVAVTTNLNTQGLLGDFAIFVRVDPDRQLAESNTANNDASFPFEIRHAAPNAPSNLQASASGSTVNLSWTASPLAGLAGYYVTHNDELVVSGSTDVAPQAIFVATSTASGSSVANLADGQVSTAWFPLASDPSARVTGTLAAKGYLTEVAIVRLGAISPWRIEYWDGTAFVELAAGATLDATIAVSPPIKTTKVRVTSPTGLREVRIRTANRIATAATTFADNNRTGGDHAYALSAVNGAGIESVPAKATTTLPLPDAPSGLLASVSGNDVTLTFSPVNGNAAAGTIIRRDGKPINGQTDLTALATMASSTAQSPAQNSNDNNTNTAWAPLATDPTPSLEARYARPRLISRVDVNFTQTNVTARDFDIQTWDGTKFVTRMEVRNLRKINLAHVHRFDLPDAYLTSAIRLQIITPGSAGVQITELDTFEVTPYPTTQSTVVDRPRRTAAYTYTATTVTTLSQEGAPSLPVTATVVPPAAPTNLVATLASPTSASLSYTLGSEPNLAGVYVWRDGILVNGASPTNIAPRGTVTYSLDPTAGVLFTDENSTNGIAATLDGSQAISAELVFPRAEMVRRIQLSLTQNQLREIQVQIFDGTSYQTRATLATPFNLDVVLPRPERTSRIRILFPPQIGLLTLSEIRVFGVAPAPLSAFTDTALTEGNHTWQVSAVSVVDDEGPRSAPAVLSTGDIDRPPGNLVASANGQDVALSWPANTQAAVTGYRVYRDFVAISGLIGKATPSYEDIGRPTGAYTYFVRSVDATGAESIASNSVVVQVTDQTPPAPPTNLRITTIGRLEIAWDASPSADVFGYKIYADRSTTPVSPVAQTQRTFFEAFHRGQLSYTYEVSSVDRSGLEGAKVVISATIAAPTPPANPRASAANQVVSIAHDGSTGTIPISGYRLFRDSMPVLGNRAFAGSSIVVDASSLLIGSNTSLLNDVSAGSSAITNTSYVSGEDAWPVTLTMTDTVSTPIDWMRIAFTGEAFRGIDFDVDVRTKNGMVRYATVRNNNDLEVVLPAMPGQPPIADQIRLTVLRGGGRSLGIRDWDVRSAIASSSTAPFSVASLPGLHRYQVQAENVAGVMSVLSAEALETGEAQDFAISANDVRFSRDLVEVGQTVGISAWVHNLGSADGSIEVTFFGGNPAQGAPVLSTQTLTVPAGRQTEARAEWTIPANATNVYVQVDRSNVTRELSESNNIALKGLPFHYPYRTISFAPGGLFASIYKDNTTVLVRNAAGQLLGNKTGNRGQILEFIVPKDVYTISGTEKFGLVWGDEQNSASGHFLLDQENRAYSTEFYFDSGFSHPFIQKIFVFAREAGTTVAVTDAQTNAIIGSGTIDAGKWLRMPVASKKAIHVVANKPVAVLNYPDSEYSVPATNGTYAGTQFYTFVGIGINVSRQDDLNLYAYQDNTSYTVRDLETNTVKWQGVLNENGFVSLVEPGFQEHFYEISSSNNISVATQYYTHGLISPGFHGGSTVSNSTGTLIGLDLMGSVGPTLVFGGNSNRFGFVFAYYDNTQVTVREISTIPAVPIGQLGTTSMLLHDGQAGTFMDPNDGRPMAYRIRANKPVSSAMGAVSGLAAGGPSPLFFASANDADLVAGLDIHLDPGQPVISQPVRITGHIDNMGARAAENFFVEVWDNAPEENGRRLYQEFVTQLVMGEPLAIETTWQAEEGSHKLYLIADRLGTVTEKDETNNRSFVLAPMPADLAIANSDIVLTPNRVLPRQPTRVDATVHNLGGAASQNVVVALYQGDPAAGGRELARKTVDVLSGLTTAVSFTVDTNGFARGNHGLYVKLDVASAVTESREDNNTASAILEVAEPDKPDLAIARFIANPNPATAGQDVALELIVENYGKALTNPVTLTITDGPLGAGGQVVASQPVVVVGTSNVVVTWPGPRTLGSHQLVAYIDAASEVDEASETNNEAQASVLATASDANLVVTTDRASYAPSATAVISTTISLVPENATLHLELRDGLGALIATIVDAAPATVGSGQLTFPMHGLLPGAYRVSGTLVTASGVASRSDATFSVTGDAAVVASLVSGQVEYAPNATADLIASLANGGTNEPLGNLELRLTATDSREVVVASITEPLGSLAPLARVQRPFPLPLTNASAGEVKVRLEIVRAGAVIATATTQFTISTSAAIAGQIEASPRAVEAGTPVAIVRSLEALGNTTAMGQVRTSIVDALSGAVLLSAVEPITIAPGTPHTGGATIETGTLAGRPYLAVVEVLGSDNRVLFRGFTGFEVTVSTPTDTAPPVIAIAGVEPCARGPITPAITVTDASAVTTVATLDGAPYVSGAPISAQGSHVLLVSATDAANNHAERSVTFILDTTAPVVTITGVTDGQVSTAAVTPIITATDTNLVSTTSTLNSVPFASGTAVATEGAYALAATATDCAGNQATENVSFTIDQAAPQIAITGLDDGQCNEGPVTPIITVTDAGGTTVTITLDGQPYTSGTPVATDGNHHLVVLVQDGAGNVATVERHFIVDTTPPQLAFVGLVDGVIRNQPIPINLTVSEANVVSSSVTVDGMPIASGQTVSVEGPHEAMATVTDCAGHTQVLIARFTIDMTPPTIAIAGVLAGQCDALALSPTITITEANPDRSEITLNGAPYTSGSPVTGEGNFTLSVAAVDRAGNSSVDTITFVIDRTPPAVAIGGIPANPYSRVPVTPTVSITDAHLVSQTVLLDSLPFTSGTTIAAQGSYALTAAATDCAGNQADRSATFVIDTTPPTVELTGFAANECSAQPVLVGADAFDTYLVQTTLTIDGAVSSNPTTVSASGQHQVRATANDLAGNSTTVNGQFTIQTVAPSISIAGVTPDQLTNQTVTPVVTVTGQTGGPVVVTLDGAPTASGTPVSTEGEHTLAVSTTACGGRPVVETRTFTIDKTLPVIAIAGVTNGSVYTDPVSVTVTVTDTHPGPVATLLDGAPYANGSPIAAPGSHTLSVDTTDAAGNRAQRQVQFTLDVVAGTVAGAKQGLGRVLIAIECTSNCASSHPAFLKTTLTNAGIPFVVAEGRTAWKNALRSDRYGVVVVYLPSPSESGSQFKELNEAVAFGNGLVLIKDHPDNMPNLNESLGGQAQGKVNNVGSVVLSGPLGPGTVPVTGSGVRISLTTGAVAGKTPGTNGVVVASTNTLGAGKSVVLHWDTERNQSTALGQLYLRAIGYVTPTTARLVPNGTAEVEYLVSATGSATSDPFVLTMQPVGPLTFLFAIPTLTTTNPWAWSFTLAPQAQKVLVAQFTLPGISGTYGIHAKLERVTGGVRRLLSETDTSLDILLGREALKNQIIADLQALTLSGGNASARTNAISDLNHIDADEPPTTAQAEAAVGTILNAINRVRGITGVDVMPIRTKLGQLLRSFQTKAVPVP